MSYTFSRRDFMKYSAVAAVAVAGSSMFTGCGSFSNPNRPYGTYKGEDCKLTFGGKSGGILGFGGTEDHQILKTGATYDSNTQTLILPFEPPLTVLRAIRTALTLVILLPLPRFISPIMAVQQA